MERRKFVIGVGSLVSGAAAGVGTGAVSSITADRDATFSMEGDSNAYLTLEPGDNHYVTQTDGGLIQFDFDRVNKRADTTLEEAFTIKNAADRELYVWAQVLDEFGNVLNVDTSANLSVELLVDGTDITYPGGREKNDVDTSRFYGKTEETGAVKFTQGQAEDVEMRIFVRGDTDELNVGRIVFHADEDEPEGRSDWKQSLNYRD